ALPLIPGLTASLHLPERGEERAPAGGGVNPWSPGVTHFGSDSGSAQSVREYTFGLTGRLVQNERWTHTLTAGMDGYTLAGEAMSASPVVSPSDSALRDARGEAERVTLRA